MCLVKPQAPQYEPTAADRQTYINSLPESRVGKTGRGKDVFLTKEDSYKLQHPWEFPDIFKQWAQPGATTAAGTNTESLTAPVGLQRRKPRSLLGVAGAAGDNSAPDLGVGGAKAQLGA